ncbi:MAG: hypothetical protein ACREN2_08920 [Candidatus Dormibacteria bacterium]
MRAASVAFPRVRVPARSRMTVLLVLTIVIAAVAIAVPRGLESSARPVLMEQTYRLALDTTSGNVEVQTPLGVRVTSMPLTMWAGDASRPVGARLHMRQTGNTVEESVVANGGHDVLQRVVLTAHQTWFGVRDSLGTVDAGATTPRFFFDGQHGLDVSGVHGGYSPAAPASTGMPALPTAGRLPLAPAPLQVQLHTSGGWLGVGLAEVPNATELRVDPRGAVDVDYPLHLLSSVTDTGSGGYSNGMLRFPEFIFTLAQDTGSGLSAYHAAVVAAGAAPATAPAQAAWWHMPIVDTWGAQMAEQVQRGSPGFTTGWVRQFVKQEQAQYGLTKFTLVIDSRWQQELGAAAPDAVRFGGVAGMRSLIDDLHAMGLRVMLWWPMWSTGTVIGGNETPAAVAAIDPTAAGFDESMTTTVTQLLGLGPGDLDADGLKLDWEYRIPPQVANPAVGIGDAALYHYFDVIHRAAHAVKPGALVEASAASPQFQTVTDSVRLYDAWNEAAWDQRAAIVAAADPGVLIDGDGWEAQPADAIPHVLSSTVYGVPAIYFGSIWGNGAPVPEATQKLLGAVAALAADKGSGRVVALPGGGWEFVSNGHTVAQTLNGDNGAVVWSRGPKGALLGHVVSSFSGQLKIPLPQTGKVTMAGPSGARVAVHCTGNRALARVTAHDLYTITVS